jgi:hypothetical protein
MIYIVTYGIGAVIKGIFLSEANAKACKESMERSHPHDYFFIRPVESDILYGSGEFAHVR